MIFRSLRLDETAILSWVCLGLPIHFATCCVLLFLPHKALIWPGGSGGTVITPVSALPTTSFRKPGARSRKTCREVSGRGLGMQRLNVPLASSRPGASRVTTPGSTKSPVLSRAIPLRLTPSESLSVVKLRVIHMRNIGAVIRLA